MLGWGVGIFKQKNGGRSPASSDSAMADDEDAAMPALAGWDAEIGGVDWIYELVKGEKAYQVHKGWSLRIYTVQAKHIMFLLKSPPPCVFTYGDRQEYYVDEQQLRSCPPEEWLIVSVCDLG